MTINQRLAELRAEHGLSLTRTTVLTGISGAYIWHIEAGTYKPSPEKLRRFAEAYGVPYFELMELAGYIEEDDVKEYLKAAKLRPRVADEGHWSRRVILAAAI